MKPIFKNTPNECTKTEDGRTVFLSRSIAVCVPIMAVTANDECFMLISQRGAGTPDFQYHYNLVCGYLDFDENLHEAAKREIWEETGFNIDDIPKDDVFYRLEQYPWAICSEPTSNKQNVTMRYGLVFRIDDTSCLPKLTNKNCEPNEVIESIWMDYNECLKMDGSESKIDPIENKVWAFNHFDVLREFIYLEV